MEKIEISPDRKTMTVFVPMTFKKRGARKLMIAPDGSQLQAAPRPRIDNKLIKATARAFRWRNLLETGVYGTVEDIAEAEKINASYVSRIVRLTLLAPNIIEGILDGRQGPEITLEALKQPFPVEWERQLEWFEAR